MSTDMRRWIGIAESETRLSLIPDVLSRARWSNSHRFFAEMGAFAADAALFRELLGNPETLVILTSPDPDRLYPVLRGLPCRMYEGRWLRRTDKVVVLAFGTPALASAFVASCGDAGEVLGVLDTAQPDIRTALSARADALQRRHEMAEKERQERSQVFQAAKERRLDALTAELRQSPMFRVWRADFRARVEMAMQRLAALGDTDLGPTTADDVEREAELATLEAITRAARRRRWAVRHTSQHNGRNTSRYIMTPWGEVRLSDHDLPETPQRFERMIAGGRSRWDGEVVIGDGWRTTSLEQWMRRIERAARHENNDQEEAGHDAPSGG